MLLYEKNSLTAEADVIYLEDNWGITNDNLNINKIAQAKINGQIFAMSGITEDETKIYITNSNSDIDETNKKITLFEDGWFELVNDIDVLPYLTGNIWTIRGLTSVKTDLEYKATIARMEVGFIFKSDGSLQATFGEEKNELSSEYIDQEIKNEEILIENTNVFSWGSLDELDILEDAKIVFSENGQTAQFYINDVFYGNLYTSETKFMDSYLYYNIEPEDLQDSQQHCSIFIDTDYSVEVWLSGDTDSVGDYPILVGNGVIMSNTITKSDGTQEYQERSVYITISIAGQSRSLTIGYITEDNNLYILANDNIRENRRLLSESMNFSQIYDTEERNSSVGINMSYGLVPDEDSTTTGTYYILFNLKGKYDCVVNIPAEYKIEDGKIYLEERSNDINLTPLGTFDELPSSAKLRQ